MKNCDDSPIIITVAFILCLTQITIITRFDIVFFHYRLLKACNGNYCHFFHSKITPKIKNWATIHFMRLKVFFTFEFLLNFAIVFFLSNAERFWWKKKKKKFQFNVTSTSEARIQWCKLNMRWNQNCKWNKCKRNKLHQPTVYYTTFSGTENLCSANRESPTSIKSRREKKK